MNTDPNSLLEPVGSQYGSPMGRASTSDNPAATVILFRVKFVDGDYDVGGVYWGGGDPPLYAAIGEDFRYFLRSESLETARRELLGEFPSLTIEAGELNDDFFAAYLECALWLATDSSGDYIPETEFTPEDISPECLEKMRFDCLDFWIQAGNLLSDENCNTDKWEERAGHDFWLTRNRHGGGFWDGDWREPAASELTRLAHSFGEVEFYVENGKIECD